MVNKPSIFKYNYIKGPLHKVPAIIKIIFFIPIIVFCVTLTSLWLCIGIGIMILSAFICRLSLHDQMLDLKPVLFYILFIYLLSILSNIINYDSLNTAHFSLFIPNSEILRIMLRIILIVQISSVFFRTTSSLEIRDAVKLNIITLFLMFIPEIFNTWSNINLAWKARASSKGIKKVKNLLFALISLSFEKAFIKSKALEARSKIYDVKQS